MSASRYERGNLEQNDYADLYLAQRRERQDRASDEEHRHRRRRGQLLARQQARRVLGARRFQVHAPRAHLRSPRRPIRPRRGRSSAATFDYDVRVGGRGGGDGVENRLVLVGERRHDLLRHRLPRDDAALRALRRERRREADHRSSRRRFRSARDDETGRFIITYADPKTPPATYTVGVVARRRRQVEVDAAHRSESVGRAPRSRSATKKRSRGSRPTARMVSGVLVKPVGYQAGQALSAHRRDSRRPGRGRHAQLQRRLQLAGLRRRGLRRAACRTIASRRNYGEKFKIEIAGRLLHEGLRRTS